ncbi:MAG TPA: putative toxin-antitoxin system toxin component, PIN family [Rhodocyclaceae bacterium]|nr:putative toxin-antitoxin system toxin component, PIN family [Rhodocyclaceae bacterium]
MNRTQRRLARQTPRLSLSPSPCDRPLQRIVFDTNVLLSLYVFADSRFLPLRTQIEQRRWQALTDVDCLAEFRRVLSYPQFKLDAERQDRACADYLLHAEILSSMATAQHPLPRCQDRDDQKFLELARNGDADALITADRALLRLARHERLRNEFCIITPTAALQRQEVAAACAEDGDRRIA